MIGVGDAAAMHENSAAYTFSLRCFLPPFILHRAGPRPRAMRLMGDGTIISYNAGLLPMPLPRRLYRRPQVKAIYFSACHKVASLY